ncbi:MAG: 50S ribosomal protein L29 [Candidatus Woykebacteria bacterium RIFCSPHIGHO2_12_FULL_45_10]|uniref:Large ribosomal subunit protein uL29 n=1 Tax=Candidatus Woykebacteria bacterium RIFCSPHIGHO2_12_FULL_45_10 TaxID=1802603 RepID=A0A1G1WMW9_9BACT|nr:MAG: 50S ribosomal protein L29 [Candidatus Woykebacteria bacterium RIFCSPHIGHO2_12_FULL_45_10]
MKKPNFNDKTLGELKSLAQEAKKALLDLSVQRQQRKLKDVHAINKKKKETARILTAARVKEPNK